MESSRELFDILLTDYKTLKRKSLNIFIIKFTGIISLILCQIILGANENILLFTLLSVFLILITRENKENIFEIKKLSEAMSQFNTAFYYIQIFQERKYFENKNQTKNYLYNIFELLTWLLVSGTILYFKIFYLCKN